MEKANAKYGGRVQTYLKKLDQFHQAEDYHQVKKIKFLIFVSLNFDKFLEILATHSTRNLRRGDQIMMDELI